VKWVGAQFHTTGVAEVDWFVTDRFETPPHLARLYGEKLLTMPASYVCYDPPADAPEVGKLPVRTTRRMTFGSFNSFAKITPQVLAAWAAVLARVPRARLLIVAVELGEPAMAARVRQAFATFGIAPRRIEVVGGLDHRALLARYNDVDLALQPFPYCGGVTLLEGLWMGVPSIALAGESFAARHGPSHLSQVGLADFVATSPEDYVARAVAMAADRRRLAQLRSSLRARVRESPLCDRAGFAAALGGALRRAWAAWCDAATP
jgi:predicted O-linked N-acetylglucosamine transferase (SPINDLY family)